MRRGGGAVDFGEERLQPPRPSAMIGIRRVDAGVDADDRWTDDGPGSMQGRLGR